MFIFKYLKDKFLKIFGDIKVFKYPFFLVYDPDDYLINGPKIRDIISTVQPGDLLIRRYQHYLDGWFIPGKYSHTGIYIGDGKVIHSVAEGVTVIDIFDFIKCDGIAIVRPSSGQDDAIEKAKELVSKNTQYDFDFEDDNDTVYCHELAALCYNNLRIEKKVPKLFYGLIRLHQKKYLAESFLTSPDFTLIKEY